MPKTFIILCQILFLFLHGVFRNMYQHHLLEQLSQIGKNMCLSPTILFVGGTRSGKSGLAQKWAEQQSTKRIFVATLLVRDKEMLERVQMHQLARGSSWAVVEVEINLLETLHNICCKNTEKQVIIVDCISTWITNMLEAGLAEDDITTQTQALSTFLQETRTPIAVVTTETGLGIVPSTALGRKFRDILGKTNQILAAGCTNVIFVSCGLPLTLKGHYAIK